MSKQDVNELFEEKTLSQGSNQSLDQVQFSEQAIPKDFFSDSSSNISPSSNPNIASKANIGVSVATAINKPLALTPLVSVEEFLKKQEIFAKAVKDDFITRLKINQDIVTGKKNVSSRKLEELANGLELADTGKEIIIEVAKFFSIAADIVPIFGPVIRGVLQIGIMALKKYHKDEVEAKSKEIIKNINVLFKNQQVLIAEELGEELARIYEYQIALLDENSIAKAAGYAVNKIMNGLGNIANNPYSSPINKLIENLFHPKSRFSFPTALQLIDIPQNLHKSFHKNWNADSMFIRPGLRIEAANNIGYNFYSYKRIDADINNINNVVNVAGSDSTSRIDKYGFRNQIMLLDPNGNYVTHPRDQKCMQSDELETNYLQNHPHYYRTARRIVTKEELGSFIANSDEKTSFNEYISEIYNIPDTIAVYRSDAAINLNINNRKFDHTDFNRVDFRQASIANSNWQNSCLRFVKLSNLSIDKIQSINLINVNMQGADLDSTDMRNAVLVNTNISYAKVSKDTNFENNFYIGLTEHQEVNLGNSYISYNINDRLQNVETATVRLKEEQKKLREEQADLKEDHEKFKADFKETKDKVSKLTPNNGNHMPIIHYTKPVHFYSDRRELFEISEHFKYNNALALTGIAGSGKTQLARNFAQTFESKLTNLHQQNEPFLIWELLSDTESNLIISYRELGIELNKFFNNKDDQELKKASTLVEIRTLIASKLGKYQAPYLLIYDNLELNVQDACILVNAVQGKQQYSIITSIRAHHLEFHHDTIPSISLNQGLSLGEAQTLLLKGKLKELQTKAEQASAEELAEELEGLPLALAAAKLYMGDDVSIHQYREVLQKEKEAIEQQQTKLLRSEAGYPAIIEAAIRLVIEKACAKNPGYQKDIINMLNISSFLAPDSIPVILFETAIEQVEEKSSFTTTKECIRILEDLSILKDRKGVDKLRTVSVHRITQNVADLLTNHDQQELNQENLKKGNLRKGNLKQTLDIVLKHFKKNTKTPLDTEINRLLFPHVEMLIKHIRQNHGVGSSVDTEQYQYLARLLNIKAYTCTQLGWSYQNAMDFSKEAKQICEQIADIKSQDFSDLKTIYSKLYIINPNLPLLYTSILYTYGRVYFYDKQLFKTFKEESQLMFQYSYRLSEIIEHHTKNPIFYKILSKRNGSLYFNLDESSKEKLLEAEEAYYKMLNDNGIYFDEEDKEEGKKELSTDYFHKMMCSRQLLKTYKSIIKLLNDDQSQEIGNQNSNQEQNQLLKKSYYDKAAKHMNNMIDLIKKDDKEKRRIAIFYNEIADLLSATDNPNRDLDQAKHYFELSIKEEESQQDGKGLMDFPLADAYKGVAIIEMQQENYDKAMEYITKSIKIRNALHPIKTGDIENPELLKVKKLQEQIQQALNTKKATISTVNDEKTPDNNDVCAITEASGVSTSLNINSGVDQRNLMKDSSKTATPLPLPLPSSTTTSSASSVLNKTTSFESSNEK